MYYNLNELNRIWNKKKMRCRTWSDSSEFQLVHMSIFCFSFFFWQYIIIPYALVCSNSATLPDTNPNRCVSLGHEIRNIESTTTKLSRKPWMRAITRHSCHE